MHICDGPPRTLPLANQSVAAFYRGVMDLLRDMRNGIVGDSRGSEFAGACYSPDGDWLFVNIQSPGITFAITGPWQTGAL